MLAMMVGLGVGCQALRAQPSRGGALLLHVPMLPSLDGLYKVPDKLDERLGREEPFDVGVTET